jgi:formylglycine-generating enzyme required for sulfatase activity
VRGLYTRLTQDGVDAWFDKAKLLPGQDWELEIRKAVREADVVVVCLSKQFNQAGFRQKEVRLALDTAMEKTEGEIFIIPARLEECDNLESLRKWHWVDLFEEDGYEMLMRALRARANKIGATLQIKKSWLPNISSSGSKSEKIVEQKKYVTSNTETREAPDREKLEREAKNTEHKYKREDFLSNVRYQLTLLRINSLPIMSLLIGVAGLILFAFYLQKNLPRLTQALNSTPQPSQISTEVLASAKTFTPIPASETPTLNYTSTRIPVTPPTKNIAVTPTQLPIQTTDEFGVEMVLVAAGEFTMGIEATAACPNTNTSSYWDCEKTYTENTPLRSVFLDTFYIDRNEVTNARYQECVSAQQCKPPTDTQLGNLYYYGNKSYDSYPVVWITLEMAKQYCTWRGAHLPSSAEWEKAARGTDQRYYPWGNETDVYLRANGSGSRDGFQVTAPVGYFMLGESPYGILDMAGNVSELVSNSAVLFDLSGNTYTYPMTKGGSWDFYGGNLFTYSFDYIYISSDSSVGFRCARDIKP